MHWKRGDRSDKANTKREWQKMKGAKRQKVAKRLVKEIASVAKKPGGAGKTAKSVPVVREENQRRLEKKRRQKDRESQSRQ